VGGSLHPDAALVTPLFEELGGDALVVYYQGRPRISLGNADDTFNLASIRKCLLSALYGIRVADGVISPAWTLGELGIDDSPPALTEAEKEATVEDLLRLRSGVYHVANYEGAAAKLARPARGSQHHGTNWYYNNWDANVLGTIYRQQTGSDIFQDFKRFIADRIGMADYEPARCEHVPPDAASIHPAYVFRLTAADLVRFVQLYLDGGKFGDQQIIPADWIHRSLTSHGTIPDGNGFGYLWEVSCEGRLYGAEVGDGAFAFSGFPGHYVVGLPRQHLAITYAHSYALPGKQVVQPRQFARLLERLVQHL
jgi:CubicO group peptidase (beta-lactamase class C family)